jgi:hypothetical protein
MAVGSDDMWARPPVKPQFNPLLEFAIEAKRGNCEELVPRGGLKRFETAALARSDK